MKKLRKKSKRYKRFITAMVLSALMMSPGEVGYTQEYLYYDGKPIAEMQFVGTDAGVVYMGNGEYLLEPAEYDLSATIMDATKSATSYWIDILGSRAKNSQPWQIFVTTKKNYQNANAGTETFSREDGQENITIIPENYVARLLQTGAPLSTLSAETSDGSSSIAPGTYSVSNGTFHFNHNGNKAYTGTATLTISYDGTNKTLLTATGSGTRQLGSGETVEYSPADGNTYTASSGATVQINISNKDNASI